MYFFCLSKHGRLKLSLLTGFLALLCACQQPSTRQSYQYAAKITCTTDIPGTSQTSPGLLPGVYETVINIHNPTYKTIKFRMKVATSGGQVSQFISRPLKPDQATAVTCKQIVSDFGLFFIHGAEGFLIIESDVSLDVTGVYTAGYNGGQVQSIDIEEVKERTIEKVEQESGPDLVPVALPDCEGGRPVCFCDRRNDSLCVTVQNVGDAAAGASDVEVDFGSFGSFTQPVPPLAPGAQVTVCFPIPLGCHDPDCDFQITVDKSGTVIETNESNNQAKGNCIG